jgi:hypothetical protein
MSVLGWTPVAVFGAAVVAATGVGLAQSDDDERQPWEGDRTDLPVAAGYPLSITDLVECPGPGVLGGIFDFVLPVEAPAPPDEQAPGVVSAELGISEQEARRLTYTWHDESQASATYIVRDPDDGGRVLMLLRVWDAGGHWMVSGMERCG